MLLIEIVIVVAFIFFLLSVLASGLNEVFALLLNKRGRELQRAMLLIFNQLDDHLIKDFYDHPLIKPTAEKPKWDSLRGMALHLINYFRRGNYKHHFPPSYIDSKIFARALSDILVMGKDLQPAQKHEDIETLKELYNGLQSLDYNNYRNYPDLFLSAPSNHPMAEKIWEDIKTSRGRNAFDDAKDAALADLTKQITNRQVTNISDSSYFEKLKTRLITKSSSDLTDYTDLFTIHSENLPDWHQQTEKWFDQYMDRVSGWYKKRSHTNIFWMSILIVVFFNLDAIELTKAVYSSELARSRLLATASTLEKGTAADILFEYFDQILEFDIPTKSSLKHLPGWIITIMAMSLGAPFWFSFLSRFTRLGASGPKPAPSGSDHAGDNQFRTKTSISG